VSDGRCGRASRPFATVLFGGERRAGTGPVALGVVRAGRNSWGFYPVQSVSTTSGGAKKVEHLRGR
jgi:hypothetical protein